MAYTRAPASISARSCLGSFEAKGTLGAPGAGSTHMPASVIPSSRPRKPIICWKSMMHWQRKRGCPGCVSTAISLAFSSALVGRAFFGAADPLERFFSSPASHLVMCGLPHSLLNGLGLSRCGAMAARNAETSAERRAGMSPLSIDTALAHPWKTASQWPAGFISHQTSRGNSVGGGGHCGIHVDPVLSPEGIYSHLHVFNQLARCFMPSSIRCDRHTTGKDFGINGRQFHTFTNTCGQKRSERVSFEGTPTPQRVFDCIRRL